MNKYKTVSLVYLIRPVVKLSATLFKYFPKKEINMRIAQANEAHSIK